MVPYHTPSRLPSRAVEASDGATAETRVQDLHGFPQLERQRNPTVLRYDTLAYSYRVNDGRRGSAN
eukprot:scaffold297207_cov41-Prasinocladus_malaysianus.AAC.1